MAKSEEGKPRVIWNLSNDGLLPSKAPFGFVIRNPLQVIVLPGQKRQISLHVAANVPLLAFPTRNHLDDIEVEQIIPQGQDVVVTIVNKSLHTPLVIDDKEGIVCVHPLLSDAVGEVG
jgi:hypothetical protein